MNQDGLSAAASLVEDLDKRLMVILRDGRKYVGILRSFDQFSNIVLSDAVERIIVDRQFGDIPLGLYIVRGENVVLMARARRACTSLFVDFARKPHHRRGRLGRRTGTE